RRHTRWPRDWSSDVCSSDLFAHAQPVVQCARAVNGVPSGRLVSFGLAGALHNGLRIGEVLDATRVVDARGETLWHGAPLGVHGAREVTVLASDDLVHDAGERRRLHESSGADAVDMESGVLARSGRL